MTVLELIQDALGLAGKLGMGQAIGATVQAGCLRALNTMLGNWSTGRLIVYAIVEDRYPLAAEQQAYALGPGADDWDAPRPQRVESARWVKDGQRGPVEVLTRQRWEDIRRRGATAEHPAALYPEMTLPDATIHVWPVPADADVELELSMWRPVAAFAAVSENVVFPPGYDKALVYNLAVELAPRFEDANLSQIVVDQARESLAAIKRMNLVPPELACDAALLGGGRFDILSGDYSR